jgi:hypothetical protein
MSDSSPDRACACTEALLARPWVKSFEELVPLLRDVARHIDRHACGH